MYSIRYELLDVDLTKGMDYFSRKGCFWYLKNTSGMLKDSRGFHMLHVWYICLH